LICWKNQQGKWQLSGLWRVVERWVRGRKPMAHKASLVVRCWVTHKARPHNITLDIFFWARSKYHGPISISRCEDPMLPFLFFPFTFCFFHLCLTESVPLSIFVYFVKDKKQLKHVEGISSSNFFFNFTLQFLTRLYELSYRNQCE